MADTAINPGVGALRLTGYIPLVVQSNTAAAVTPIGDMLRSLFPSQPVPAVDDKGRFQNEWYGYLRATLGAQIQQLAAIQVNLELIRTNSSRLDALVDAINAMAVQNAAAIKQTITVIQAAAIPGAAMIPPVQEEPVIGGGD